TYLSMNMKDSVELSSDGLADPTAVANESEAIDQALAHNYSLQALDLQLRVLDEVVALNQSAYYPALTAIGNWQNFGQSAAFDSWLSASTAFVGVNLSFNVFNGFQTMAKVEQATADYLQAEQQLANLKNVIQLQVRAAINDLQSALERITAQQSTVEQAQRGFEIARIRYTEGTGSLLEINDAETALAQARVNRLQALYDYYLARAQYDLVTGSIREELLSVAE
ncbi:MAG: TolC family protein, partial [Candidatus Kapaibacteriota bacterium]